MSGFSVHAVAGLPEVAPGDDLAGLLADGLQRAGLSPTGSDVVVVAQKVVSKSEGRLVRREDVVPGEAAQALAARLGKDPALVEVILGESRRVVRAEWPEGRGEGLLIVEHRHGHVMANAGVDASNVPEGWAWVLLPEDSDASAARLRDALGARLGVRPAVIVADTFGRPWRTGLVNVAIGVAGMPAKVDLRGRSDPAGRPLHATVLALADEVAAAAGLVLGKLGRTPAALVRGVAWDRDQQDGRATDLVRPAGEDVFR